MKYKCRFHTPGKTYFDIELDGSFRLGKYFTVEELANKNAKEEIKLEMFPHSWLFIEIMDDVREDVGVLVVNSGYRSPSYNEEIGGDPNSAHKEMCAMDIPMTKNLSNYKVFMNSFKKHCKERNIKAAMNLYKRYLHVEIDSDRFYGQKSSFILRNKL